MNIVITPQLVVASIFGAFVAGNVFLWLAGTAVTVIVKSNDEEMKQRALTAAFFLQYMPVGILIIAGIVLSRLFSFSF